MKRYLSALWLRSLSGAFVLSTLLPIHARGDVIVELATIAARLSSFRSG